jgi:hypothetical protein
MPTPNEKPNGDPADEPHHFKDDAAVDADAAEAEEEGASAAPGDDQPTHFRDDPAGQPGEEERDAE